MDSKKSTFDSNEIIGLRSSEIEERIKQFGYNEIPVKKTHPLILFLKKFFGLSAVMLEIIAALSFLLHKNYDAFIVIGLLLFNAIVGFVQEYNASGAVAALKERLKINVRVLREKNWITVPSRELLPGDIIRIRMGDFIPADAKIVNGEISVDQSALTGESAVISKNKEQIVYSGSVVTNGECEAIIQSTGVNTFYGKTIELVKSAQPKSHIDEVTATIVRWLLLIVTSLLFIAFVTSTIKGINLYEFLPLMLVLLLGAVPVALSVMFTVSMALGSKQLVQKGVLVTHLNAPNDAASMDVLLVDKTGTLTENKLSVAKIEPAPGFNEKDVLLYGYLASLESNNDPIDLAFINRVKQDDIRRSEYEPLNFFPFTPQTRRTEAKVRQGSIEFKVTKGSFNTIAALCELEENEKKEWISKTERFAQNGNRTIAVAISRSNKYLFVGLAALHDPPRSDSKKLIGELKDMGVSVKMITGDAVPVAIDVAETVGLGNRVITASAFRNSDSSSFLKEYSGIAEVYPEDKYTITKGLQQRGHIVGMTGDGVNDAPALKQAEVGIAVKNATDAAKSSASIVLTKEGLINIIEPIKIGRMMFERINTWILNKFARTILKTGFVVFSFIILGKYVISATAMLIMIFMTDFVKISLASDNVKWSATPAKWQIKYLAVVGVIIGLLMMVEAFALLYIGLYYFNLKTDDASLNTFCFELLLFFALFSIFVVREKRHFWQSMPGTMLVLIILLDMIAGVCFSTFGIFGFKPIPITQTFFVIGYTFIFSLIVNDLIKVQLLKNKTLKQER